MGIGLPVSRLVNVTVNLTPAPAQFANFNSCVIVGSSNVIDVKTRMRSYSDLDEVADDFGTTAPEYLAAVLWFEQVPQPNQLLIARWAKTASAGQLFGGVLAASEQALSVWNAITTGAFKITIDGGAAIDITGLNFALSANLNNVAQVISTALAGHGASCVWDANFERFEITSNTTGISSAIAFLSAPTSGTDISDNMHMTAADVTDGCYQVPGIAAETALACVQILENLFNSQWYGIVVLGAADADYIAIAGFIEASNTKHFHGVGSTEGGIITAGDTSSIAYQLSQLKYKKTAVQYSSSNVYAVVSLLARILTTNWSANNTTITLMYKQEPGIVAETLNTSQINAAEAVWANVFVNYNNSTAIIERGTTCSGDFIDTIIGCDWLADQIMENVYNELYTTNTKVPQTDAGMHTIGTAIEAACQAAVNNGLVAPGQWNAGGFGQLVQGQLLKTGYYIYVPPVASQPEADRAARKSVPIQVAVKLAGAVQTVDVLVNVNR